MKTNNKPLSKFFAVTASGGVYEITYAKRKTTAKKIFSANPSNSKAKVGYELNPKGKFIGITIDLGLWKCQPDDGKKFKFEDHWDGTYVRTSEIRGLFFEKAEAVRNCEYRHNNPRAIEPNKWHESETTRAVLERIGLDHPVFIIVEELQPKEVDLPF
jgi:hypothetical protein